MLSQRIKSKGKIYEFYWEKIFNIAIFGSKLINQLILKLNKLVMDLKTYFYFLPLNEIIKDLLNI